MADDVVSTARLEGADKVVAEFNAMGAAGQAATAQMASGLDPLNKGLDSTARTLKNIEAASYKFGSSLRDVGTAASQFGNNISRVVNTVARYATYIGTAVAVANKLARANEDTSAATKEAVKQNQLSNKSLADAATRAINNQKAIDDLAVAYRRGEISMADYSKQLIKLREDQAREEEVTRAREVAQELATETRMREEAAIKQQAQAQKDYADSVRSFGADIASALTQFGTSWDSFLTTFNQGQSRVADIIRSIANMLQQNGQEIVDLYNSVAEQLGKVWDGAEGGASDFGQRLLGLFKGVADVIKSYVIPAFAMVLTVFRGVAAALNAVFGTNVSGEALLLVTVLLQWVGALKLIYSLIASITLAFNVMRLALVALASTPMGLLITALTAIVALLVALNWDKVAEAAKAAWQWIVNTWNAAPGFFKQLWDGIVSIWNAALDALKSAAQSTVNAIVDFFTWLTQPIRDFIGWVGKAIEALKKLGRAKEEAGAGGGGEGGFKRGGLIRGPGTGTSDSVPIWASAGEWMMRTRAVQYYGRSFMAAVNSLRFPRGGLDGLSEAMVMAPPRARFAAGGEVTRSSGSDGRPVILQFPDGQKFVLNAASETADRLGHYAVARRLASSGRKPSYYGGG